MRRRDRYGIGEDLIKGAIAGAVATWVMGKVTGALHRREGRWADANRERFGSAVHWALGVGSGAAYAVLRRRLTGVGRVAGVGFGTIFWAAVDEGLVPALGLTPGPRAFPWQTHARGLAGHLTFGTVTDGTLRLLDAVV
jgi:uncharacterized membrane protein YagU involved in acid resistance